MKSDAAEASRIAAIELEKHKSTAATQLQTKEHEVATAKDMIANLTPTMTITLTKNVIISTKLHIYLTLTLTPSSLLTLAPDDRGHHACES